MKFDDFKLTNYLRKSKHFLQTPQNEKIHKTSDSNRLFVQLTKL